MLNVNKNCFFRLMVIAWLCLLVAPKVVAQDGEVLQTVKKQIKAFNGQNIQSLVDNVTEDFKWYYIGQDTLMLEVSGKIEFKKSMEGYFAQIKTVKSEIAGYTIDGNRMSFKEVVQYETFTGKKGTTSAMAVYEVKSGLIRRVWYFF